MDPGALRGTYFKTLGRTHQKLFHKVRTSSQSFYPYFTLPTEQVVLSYPLNRSLLQRGQNLGIIVIALIALTILIVCLLSTWMAFEKSIGLTF